LVIPLCFSDEEDNALQRIGASSEGSGYVGIPSVFIPLPAGDFIESSIEKGFSIQYCVDWRNTVVLSVYVSIGLTVTGHVTPYATDDVANQWIDLAFVEWAENIEDRCVHVVLNETL
jgi:hypothetical protein